MLVPQRTGNRVVYIEIWRPRFFLVGFTKTQVGGPFDLENLPSSIINKCTIHHGTEIIYPERQRYASRKTYTKAGKYKMQLSIYMRWRSAPWSLLRVPAPALLVYRGAAGPRRATAVAQWSAITAVLISRSRLRLSPRTSQGTPERESNSRMCSAVSCVLSHA